MTHDDIRRIASIVGGDKTYRHFVHRINKEFEAADREHTSQVKVIFEEKNGETIGFSVLGSSPTKMSVWEEMFIEEGWVQNDFQIDSKAFELMYMYIKPEFRNKNLGKQLLQKAIKYSKERKSTELYAYVSDKDNSALEFYKKMNASILADLSDEDATTAFVKWKLQ